jgi:type II secretion system protein H
MTMGQKGFSLVELVVVIATMIILTSIATLQFSSMIRKREMEKQTRMLYTDLTEVRQKALYEKTPRVVRLTSNEFRVYPGDSTAATPTLSRAFSYPIGWSTAGAVLDITFDTFGISNNNEVFV